MGAHLSDRGSRERGYASSRCFTRAGGALLLRYTASPRKHLCNLVDLAVDQARELRSRRGSRLHADGADILYHLGLVEGSHHSGIELGNDVGWRRRGHNEAEPSTDLVARQALFV